MPQVQQVEYFTYFRPDTGGGLDLNDGINFRVLHHDGLGISEFDHFSTGVPELDGEYWHGLRYKVKVITLDIHVKATTFIELENKKRLLIDTFNPSLVNVRAGRVGILRVQQANGTSVQFQCVLHEQATMPTAQHIGQANARYIFRFRSVKEPFLYEVEEQEIVYTGDSSGVGLSFPISLPFRVGSSGIFQSPVLNNNGHVETPVIIDLEGPATSPILENVTLGRRLAFARAGNTTTLTAGQHLVINTDPFAESVEIDGVSRWDKLSEAEFWQLAVGANELSFDIGGTSAATRVTLTYQRRYLGA